MTGVLQAAVRLIADSPIHCDSHQEKKTATILQAEKAIPGFQLLAESAPEIIERSPVFIGRVFSFSSTSARMIYEFGMDGSVACAAARLGYFSKAFGRRHGIPDGGCGPIELSSGSFRSSLHELLNTSSSIGVEMYAICASELGLFSTSGEVARLEDEFTSDLLHIKQTICPFGIVLITPQIGHSWREIRINMNRACREAGMEYIGPDPYGRLRLEWNPPVPREQSTPLLRLPFGEKEANRLSPMNFSQLLSATQSEKPPEIMLKSSRLEVAKKQNSPKFVRPSPIQISDQLQLPPGNFIAPSPETPK